MGALSGKKRLYERGKSPVTGSTIFAIALFSISLTAQAGKITSVPSPGTGAMGFGGWELSNVEIILNGTGSSFDEATGAYSFATDSDHTYTGDVFDDGTARMGIVLAKDWPVGEPPGIKIVNDDFDVKEGKPENCIMSTSYLEDHFLDSDDPQQVTCSGPYQSHKRYKLAMLLSSVDNIGIDGIDLVFNVEAEEGSRQYQVFQKINNWTESRLQGFTVEVGFGVGAAFTNAESSGIDLADLNISVPAEIWDENQLAHFSAGLFGPYDKHTGAVGFFDPNKRAGFLIDEYGVGVQPLTAILHATRTLGSNYVEVPQGAADNHQFGAWLSNDMLPYGIFFDDDGNPETDAALLAWYGYNPNISQFGWMGGSQDSDGAFSAIPYEEILQMGENLSYTMDLIDDLVNVGLNYVVTVGDVNSFPLGNSFTIRVTPSKDVFGTPAPTYVGQTPDPLLRFRSDIAEVLLEPSDTFVIGSLLTARVGDADLNIDPNVEEMLDVLISSDTGPGEQTLTLIEQGADRGVFAASLPEEYSNVEVGTVVSMSYYDTSSALEKKSSSQAIAEPVVISSDVSIIDFSAPDSLFNGLSRNLIITIKNDQLAAEAASGSVLLTGTDGSEFTGEFTDLKVNGKLKFRFRWTASLVDPAIAETVDWVATLMVNGQAIDEKSASTLIEVKKGKNSKR